MTSTDVYINDVRVEVSDMVSVKRSFSDLICSASLNTPLDFLADAQSMAPVFIRRDGMTIFNGIITSYSLQYQGKLLSMNIECSDLSYILAHSLLPLTYTESQALVYGVDSTPAMTGRLTFDSGCTVGNAIEALLHGTGIQYKLSGETNSYIALRTTTIPESCLVMEPGTTRFNAIQKLVASVGAIFYIKFIGNESCGVADTWANLITGGEFLTTIEISDSTHLVTSFSLDSVPELVCNRVTEEILNDNSVTNHAESIAAGAALPYLDKYFKIDPELGITLSVDASEKLTEYNNCGERAQIDMVGAPCELFNILDLTNIFYDMGIEPEISEWRITELETVISGGGVRTKAVLMSTSAEMVDIVTKLSSGSYSTEEQIINNALRAIDNSNARVAVITDTNTEEKTITIQYSGGAGAGSRESKTIRDWTL